MEGRTSTARYADIPDGGDLDRTPSYASSFDSETTDEQSFLRTSSVRRRRTWYSSYLDRAQALQAFATDKFLELTLPQRALAGLLVLVGAVLGILFLVYHHAILSKMDHWARRWRSVKGGWLLLWFASFITAFPPLFGYSYFLTTTGFIYGFPNGWFISATATVAGSACSFVVSRRLLAGFVQRIARKDDRFELFSKVLHDGDFKLLCLIRLCPLPYSLSNGAIATLTKISLRNFVLATAMISPKLITHTIVGSQMAAIGDSDKPSSQSKVVHYLSLILALSVGVFTARYVYNKVRAVAAASRIHETDVDNELEAQISPQYADDVDNPPKYSPSQGRNFGSASAN